MADLVTVKIRDLIETQSVATTDFMVLEKPTGTFKCQARYLKGATGLTPNVQVGNTTTLEPGKLATVTQRGNIENPVFDFGIPQGVQGPIGPIGPKGDTPSIVPLQTQIDNRFNALTSQQQGSSEVIDARGGYPALKARLDAINDDLIKYNDQTIVTHTTESNFSTIDATKNGYLDNILLEGKTLVVDSNNQVVLPGTQGAMLKSVGDDVNEIKINSINKNLFNNYNIIYDKAINNSNGNLSNQIDWCVCDEFIKVKNGTKYFINRGSSNSTSTSSPGYIYAYKYNNNKQYINQRIEVGLSNVFISDFDGYVKLSLKYNVIKNFYLSSVQFLNFDEYKINTKKVLYKDTDGTWKKPTLRQWDSIEKHSDSKYFYHKRSDIRSYQSGDENNPNVITDKTNTVYKITNEIVYECTHIDLISYDSQTNYSIECGPIYPKTTLKVNSYLGNVVSILKDKVSYLENMLVDGLKMVVAGNMQELAYQLYPQDFVNDVDDTVDMEVIK